MVEVKAKASCYWSRLSQWIHTKLCQKNPGNLKRAKDPLLLFSLSRIFYQAIHLSVMCTAIKICLVRTKTIKYKNNTIGIKAVLSWASETIKTVSRRANKRFDHKFIKIRKIPNKILTDAQGSLKVFNYNLQFKIIYYLLPKFFVDSAWQCIKSKLLWNLIPMNRKQDFSILLAKDKI